MTHDDDSPIYTTGQILIGLGIATPTILAVLDGASKKIISMAIITAVLALMLLDGHENGVL
jgi:hypothetical protein